MYEEAVSVDRATLRGQSAVLLDHHHSVLYRRRGIPSGARARLARLPSLQRKCAILQEAWIYQVAVWRILQCPRACSGDISLGTREGLQ
jgi:hypothetical protein